MKQVLIVIDMQNDFITGSLGTPEARAIVPNVVKKIDSWSWDGIAVTMDSHFEWGNYRYDDTLEGKKLPVRHCLTSWGSKGWELDEDIFSALEEYANVSGIDWRRLPKPTFGSTELIDYLSEEIADKVTIHKLPSIERPPYVYLDDHELTVCDLDVEVEICGLCTDICVISNALLLRAAFPNMKITCDSSCCAGVTPEKHAAALEVMRSCQIDVI